MFVLPQGYELITKGRVTIALHERYRDCLLGQGIDDPEKLLRLAEPQQSPSGRGAVPSLPVNGFPAERMMARRYLRGWFAIAAGNAVVFNAHPSARRCSLATVRALNAAGPSDYSNVVTATTGSLPDAPDDLTVGTIAIDTISLSWIDASDDETGFELERKGPLDADFDGAPGTRFYAPDLAGLDFDLVPSQLWALEFWFQVKGSTAGSRNDYFLEVIGPVTTNNPGIIYDYTAEDFIEMYGPGGRTGTAGPQVSDSAWHHAVFAFYGDAAGLGQAPARQAAVKSGLPVEIPALTVNKVCGSGMIAAALGCQMIKAGDVKLIVTGGQESMSNVPYYMKQLRVGNKMGDVKLQDGMIYDGIWDYFGDVHMGVLGDFTATEAGVATAASGITCTGKKAVLISRRE